MNDRAENARRFPFQYEGRRGRAIRLADPRNPTGHSVFDCARYTKGRHPSESVAHYMARSAR